MKTSRYNYLIIGQGLAGTLLSYTLIKQGKTVKVINHLDRTAASYIAAGLLSPITGPRLALTWQDPEPYHYALNLYQELEQVLQCHFYYPLTYIRLLDSAALQRYAGKRLQDPAYRQFITATSYNAKPAVTIHQAARIDTELLLDTYRTWLEKRDSYREEIFDEQHVTIDATGITYKDIRAEKLVYCNGLAARTSSLLPQLNFNPTKGDVITITNPTAHLNSMLGAGTIFIMPIGNDTYHVGATYEREFTDSLPSQAMRDLLSQQYEAVVDNSYTIVQHRAGIRPTTFGHHPYSFWLTEHPCVGVFTGFGSKGLSLIPAYADTFANKH